MCQPNFGLTPGLLGLRVRGLTRGDVFFLFFLQAEAEAARLDDLWQTLEVNPESSGLKAPCAHQ